MRNSFLISCFSPALQYPVLPPAPPSPPPPSPRQPLPPFLVDFHLSLWLWLQPAFSPPSASDKGMNVCLQKTKKKNAFLIM